MKSFFPKFLLALALFALTTGFGLRCSRTQVSELPAVTLEYWRVFDNEDTFTEIIASFHKLHPNITIKYKKFRYDEYETQLLNAFAEDRAPDLFSLPNTWVNRYVARMQPMPAEFALPTYRIQGTIKKEGVVADEPIPMLSARQLQVEYPDVVFQDAVLNNSTILALPLALDTMALYYNKDLFNQAGIPQPPRTWKEVQSITPQLTKRSDKEGILQSAIALGGSQNVPRAFDIVSMLMMQNGALMARLDGSPVFDKHPPGSTRDTLPGPEALQYYTDFANPSKTTYTWNNQLPNALDLFTQGRLAMFLGYSYHMDILKSSASQINWDVAPLPQVDPNNRVEYANYWVEGVSRKSAHAKEAWGFIAHAASAEHVGTYLQKTSKAPALKSLLPAITGKTPPHPYNIFTNAVLTARSWYLGKNPLVAEDIFGSMINSVVEDGIEPNKAVARAVNQISETMDVKKP